MPSLTIKDIPEPLLRKVRAKAARERRSMNSEIIRLLDEALTRKAQPQRMSAEERASAQADAWLRLSGRWRGRGSAKQEIAAIYAARTRGRPVSL
jgi:plasmid stability protein